MNTNGTIAAATTTTTTMMTTTTTATPNVVAVVDESNAAFWELDYNIVVGSQQQGKLYLWIQEQIRIAVKESFAKYHKDSPPHHPMDETMTTAMTQLLCHNVLTSVTALKVIELSKDSNNKNHKEPNDDEDHRDDPNSSRNKRRKKSVTIQRKIRLLEDPYHVWFQIVDDDTDNNNDHDRDESIMMTIPDHAMIWNEQQDDIPDRVGGKLAALSLGGLLNAISAVPAMNDPTTGIRQRPPGLCHTMIPTLKSLQNIMTSHPTLLHHLLTTFGGDTNMINVTILYYIATHVHQAIADQVKLDILTTTPLRIQQLLAPELTSIEFMSIRKRVYDTVILGKGMGHQMNAIDDEGKDVPTASATLLSMHDIEKYKKCSSCGNNEQSDFILDRKNGDVICSHCGTVVSESLMHEGSQFRKFEGEVDRNHHGDAANPLYSNAHNMSTSLSTVLPNTGAGIGGWGSESKAGGGGIGMKRNLETILRNAHDYTELNVSQFGKTDRRTRTGYKDRQKKDAFIQLTHTGDSLNLNEAVVQRAKEIFAGFRDDRELIQQFKGVLAACLCEAFEQLSAEGRHQLLRSSSNQNQSLSSSPSSITNGGKPETDVGNNIDNDDGMEHSNTNQPTLSAKASRRKELHHVKLAGKGGVTLNKLDRDDDKIKDEKTITNKPAVAATADDAGATTNERPGTLWNLEECRKWLIEASLRIAQHWIEERKKEDNDTTTSTSNTAADGNIKNKKPPPTIPLNTTDDELKGQLVDHAITLCEYLEMELKSSHPNCDNGGNGNHNNTNSIMPHRNHSTSKMRVVTPRVNDMTKIGIKWQNKHNNSKAAFVSNNTNPNGKKAVLSNSIINHKATKSAAISTERRTAGQILLLKTSQKLGVILKDPIAGEAFHKELRSYINQQEEKKRRAIREEASKQRWHQMQRKPWLTARIQQQDT